MALLLDEDLDLRMDDGHVRIHGEGGSVRTVLLDDRGYVTLLKLHLARARHHRTHQRASALCTQDPSQRRRLSTGASPAGTARSWSGRRTWCWWGARQERATG
ncbi:hypothetical protein ACFYUV_10150 [Nonomuraea sp. NPDC003560]|uniref:hypothetical protein n=1 Tax=Nonomuraea sp. NPDC003560 TaxID=3364341 RepID=UPI00367B1E01